MKHNQMRQVVFPILAAFIWGTAFVAQDMCADAIGAFTFNATRYSIAVLALLVVIVISDKLKKDKPTLSPIQKKAANRQLWLGGLCCGAALAMASNFQQAGMVAGTDSGKAGFLTALYVVLVPLLGVFFGRRPGVKLGICACISLAGLYLLCLAGHDTLTLTGGEWMLLLCSLLFAFQIMLVDHYSPRLDGVQLSFAEFFATAVLSTIFMFVFETPTFAQIQGAAVSIAYCGILSSGVAYTLQILGQKDLNPAIASLIMCLESVFSALGGWLLLHQNLSIRESSGCVLLFAAVVLAQLPLGRLMRSKA